MIPFLSICVFQFRPRWHELRKEPLFRADSETLTFNIARFFLVLVLDSFSRFTLYGTQIGAEKGNYDMYSVYLHILDFLHPRHFSTGNRQNLWGDKCRTAPCSALSWGWLLHNLQPRSHIHTSGSEPGKDWCRHKLSPNSPSWPILRENYNEACE